MLLRQFHLQPQSRALKQLEAGFLVCSLIFIEYKIINEGV
ncbi:hypothetical protein PNI0164_01385 [Streptococcus pneumoniae PNI0164]|nr:hypothetical protein PNI0164_01385 [Streptococcus pneumoniae PNI0164]